MEVPVDRQAFELVCDDIFVAPREARRRLSRERFNELEHAFKRMTLGEEGKLSEFNELFERAAKRVSGEEGKTKAKAVAVRLSHEWSAVLETHEAPDSLVEKKPRGAWYKLQLDAPMTTALEEVPIFDMPIFYMPIKRLSIVGGAQLTSGRTKALPKFLRGVRPKELDLHEADPALVRALLWSFVASGSSRMRISRYHAFKRLDLRGFELTADDEDLIIRLFRSCRPKFLDLRGHAISSGIAESLSRLAWSLDSLGVTTASERDAALIAKCGDHLLALYLDGEWTSSARNTKCASDCVASFVDGDLKVTSSLQCPSTLAEALPRHLSVLRLGDTLALRPLPPAEPLPSHRAASPQHDVAPALNRLSPTSPRQPDLAPAPPDLEDPTTPRLSESQRERNISFFIKTMSAIGLQPNLATKFFAQAYCWLPSHLTVRGLAQDLIAAEYDQQRAAGALAGDDLSALLVAIGFKQDVVDNFFETTKSDKIVHHQGLRNIAFDLIDSGIHRWAADYYALSDEPEDSETKPSGSTGRRRPGPSGNDRRSGGGRRGDDRRGGGGQRSGQGDDSESDESEKTTTNAREEEEEFIALFHGTTLEAGTNVFRKINLALRGMRGNTDFALNTAFYLGDHAPTAQAWARSRNRRWDPVPACLVFRVNKKELMECERKTFAEADDEWKQFVFRNRTSFHAYGEDEDVDFVIGPALANADPQKWEDCVELPPELPQNKAKKGKKAKPDRPFRQYAALSSKAIAFLNQCPCLLSKWENDKWEDVAKRSWD